MQDGLGREIDYLRISVTDKCNLRCRYCMPPQGITPLAHAEILTLEEIFRLVGIMEQLGIRKVRLTGGEPVVRKNLPWLVEKIHVFHVPPEGRKSLMERAAACGALEMVTSFAENLEFTAVGVNKGTAVQALSARLGLGPEQVMAFGDAGNDLEMLAWAGWSFAMANASAEAKKAARYETGSNAEGGVGMAVERWLLAE